MANGISDIALLSSEAQPGRARPTTGPNDFHRLAWVDLLTAHRNRDFGQARQGSLGGGGSQDIRPRHGERGSRRRLAVRRWAVGGGERRTGRASPHEPRD